MILLNSLAKMCACFFCPHFCCLSRACFSKPLKSYVFRGRVFSCLLGINADALNKEEEQIVGKIHNMES